MEAMKKFDVLVPGELNPDLILTDPDLEPRFGQAEVLVKNAALTPGSSSVIFACGAARLGLNVAFVGVVGADVFGHFMLDALESRGVDISHVIVDKDKKTGITVILNRVNDRAMITHLGTINALRESQVPDLLLSQSSHLHLASYFLQTNLQPEVPKLFQRARSMGLSTSMDTNWDPEERWNGVHDLFPLINVFLPNEGEALALSGEKSVVAAADNLASKIEVTAIKLGEKGGFGITCNRQIQLPALSVDVVDTVGAGDTFDAGFIYGYLQGWSLEKSLRLGIVCGSLSTQKSGGLDGQPTIAEAVRWLS